MNYRSPTVYSCFIQSCAQSHTRTSNSITIILLHELHKAMDRHGISVENLRAIFAQLNFVDK